MAFRAPDFTHIPPYFSWCSRWARSPMLRSVQA